MLCLDPLPHKRVYSCRPCAWFCNEYDWWASAILQGHLFAPISSSIGFLPLSQFHPVPLSDSHESSPNLSSGSPNLLVALIESNTRRDVALDQLHSNKSPLHCKTRNKIWPQIHIKYVYTKFWSMDVPFWPQGMRQREQWAMSKDLEG